jgi:hypothetical protein
LPVRPANIDLDECAGKPFLFPRRRGFARLEAHRHILYPHGLARLQGQVANDPIALVEQAEDRNSFGHWRDARLICRGARHLFGNRLIFGLVIALAASRGGGQQHKQQRGAGRQHSYSGFHAS